MTATTWELNLKGNAPTAAKRAAREVAALVKVMRDLRDVAGPASRALDGVAGPSTIRNLRTQIGLTRELGREMRKNNTESRRANRPAGGGAVNRGRTRVEGFTPGELQRLRVMEDRRRARSAAADAADGRRSSQRMQQSFRENDRLRRQSQSREGRESERHYRGIYASQQRAQAWGNRQNARAALQQQREGRANARWMERAQAQGHRDDANPFAALSRRASSAMPSELLALGGTIGIAVSALTQLYSAMVAITTATLQMVAGFGALALGLLSITASLGGAVLQMIAFREGTLMTLSTLMRVDGEDRMTPQQRQAARANAAEGELAWAQQFGRETPLSTQQVVELRTQAATAGYQGAEARAMTESAADAGALHPNDASTASRFMLQMGQLRNSAVARSADYRPAAQAAGVSETAAMRRAAIAAGVVQRGGETETAYQRRIQTAQGNGQITGRQMHDAILAEQRSQLGGGSGDFARSQRDSMAAVLSNLGEGFQAFVSSMAGVERMPGVVALKTMLQQVAATLAGATNTGKRLQAIFGGLLNRAAGFVGTLFGADGVDGFITDVMDGFKDLMPLIQAVAEEFKGGFMEGIQPLIAGFREVGGAAGGIRAALLAVLPDVRDFAKGLGSTLVLMLQITRATLELQAAFIIAMRSFAQNPAAAMAEAEGVAGLSESERAIAAEQMRNGVGGQDPAMHGVGANMADGVSAGFESRQADMQARMRAVMATLPQTANSELQIKSPSRVMAEVGEYMAEGVTVGLDSGAGGVQSAMSNVVAPPSLPGFGGGLGAMGGVNVGGVVIHVNGAQDTAGIVDELRTKVEEIFVGLFERPALAGGA